ncbi:hypothetical protein MWN34_01610 [Ancylobacter sp. 6x-1]|uniref:Oligosaccharide repeat unit polymerase n=1 Tax=Ancylobacter crimeensis TaxID=2579147 RepID=A0ABT0D718_9HYPH|nr:hypothetical protein [Ancylobacter crimeensis]MCK0195602.1 hypothetical protein [Ancylobacter crimeensis]
MERILPVFLYYAVNVVFRADLFSILITFPMFLICCFNLYRIEGKFIGFEDILWFIVFIFFVIGPLQRIDGNMLPLTGPTSGIIFSKSDMFWGTMIPTLFFLMLTIGSILFRAEGRSGTREDYFLLEDKVIILLVVNVVAFVAVVALSGGLGNLMAARSEKVREDVSTIAIFAKCMQQISCFFICILYRTKFAHPRLGFQRLVALVMSILLLLVVLNPFNTARFGLIVTWMPIGFIMLRGMVPVMPFYVAMLMGMLVVMPILSLTSRFGTSIIEAFESVNVSEAFFSLKYIDVSDMMTYLIGYVQEDGHYYGLKSLGALLFFIPRSIWTSKPTLIALDMGDELVAFDRAGTDNLSLFFGGEFYADLGMLGVAIGGLILSFVYARVVIGRRVMINGFELRNLVLMAATPILLRGPIGAVLPVPFLLLGVLFIFTMIFCVKYRAPRPTIPRRVGVGR